MQVRAPNAYHTIDLLISLLRINYSYLSNFGESRLNVFLWTKINSTATKITGVELTISSANEQEVSPASYHAPSVVKLHSKRLIFIERRG